MVRWVVDDEGLGKKGRGGGGRGMLLSYCITQIITV